MGGTCSGNADVGAIPSVKVLLVGGRRAGKTRLLYSWILGCDSVLQTIPTEDFNVEKVSCKDGSLLLVWDVCGDPSYKLKRRQFFHGTQALVYVVDSSSASELTSVKEDLTTVLQDRDLLDVPFLFIANKQDVDGALPLKEIETKLELPTLVGNRKWQSIAISAGNQSHVDESLRILSSIVFL